MGVKGLNPKIDWLLLSPYNITLQSYIKVMRIKKKWSLEKEPFNWQTNFPCQHLWKCIKNSEEKMHTDVRV